MRRLTLLTLFALCACTPAQHRAWSEWFDRDPQAAATFAINDWDHDGVVEPEAPEGDSQVAPAESPSGTDNPGEPDHETASGVCGQWHDMALAVGFSESEWPTVDRIMYAESRCSPSAYNSQAHFGGHASGLMQVVWPTWAAECGNGDIFDPWTNLSCAEYLAHTYGWSQWSTY